MVSRRLLAVAVAVACGAALAFGPMAHADPSVGGPDPSNPVGFDIGPLPLPCDVAAGCVAPRSNPVGFDIGPLPLPCDVAAGCVAPRSIDYRVPDPAQAVSYVEDAVVGGGYRTGGGL